MARTRAKPEKPQPKGWHAGGCTCEPCVESRQKLADANAPVPAKRVRAQVVLSNVRAV